jgi:ABC-2 type transport system permease protein
MRKLFLIIQREYLSRIKKKSFLIMTLVTPILFSAIMVIPILLEEKGNESRTIAVIDENKHIPQLLDQINTNTFHYLNDVSIDMRSTLVDNYEAILYIPKTESLEEAENKIIIYSDKQISLGLKYDIESHLEEKLSLQQLVNFGLDQIKIQEAEINIDIETIVVGEDGEEIKGDSEGSLGLGIVFGFMIYIFIFMYGAMVMRSVIEEKTNRIIEVIISSVKPFQLMIGKITGVALVGLTQFLLWIILGGLILTAAQSFFIPEIMPSDINNHQMDANNEFLSIFDGISLMQFGICFLFYFLGGYLLYGSLFAAVGSVVDQEADSQQFMLPITIPLILSFIMSQQIINNPHGDLAFWASMFPLTSPIIMMVRIPFGVPTYELFLSMALLIIGFLTSIWLTSKIYRTGILMYGKKVNYKEIWKWIKYKQ